MIDSEGWELAAYLDGILPVYLSFDVTGKYSKDNMGYLISVVLLQ